MQDELPLAAGHVRQIIMWFVRRVQ